MDSAETNRNLDARAENLQLRAGVVVVAFALVLAVALLRLGASPSTRLLLFLPFFLGTYGVASALVHVCGFTALLGKRVAETGREKIADRRELAQLRSRGLVVIGVSAALATAMTALLVTAS